MNVYKVSTVLNGTVTKGFYVNANSFDEANTIANGYLVENEKLVLTVLYWEIV